MTALKGIIKKRYPDLKGKGKGWINHITPEDKDALLHLVRSEGLHGHLGGKARANTAKRDKFGRFT